MLLMVCSYLALSALSAEPAATAAADAGLPTEAESALPAATSPAPELIEPNAPPPRPDPDGFIARIDVGFVTEAGVHPASMMGAALGVRIGNRRWSALLEGWTLFPTTLTVTATGSINAWSVGGVVGACGQVPVLAAWANACVLGRGGAMFVTGRNSTPTPDGWQPSAAAGARVGISWPRDSLLGFFAAAEAFVPILREQVQAGDVTWTQPWVFGGGKVGLVVTLQ